MLRLRARPTAYHRVHASAQGLRTAAKTARLQQRQQCVPRRRYSTESGNLPRSHIEHNDRYSRENIDSLKIQHLNHAIRAGTYSSLSVYGFFGDLFALIIEPGHTSNVWLTVVGISTTAWIGGAVASSYHKMKSGEFENAVEVLEKRREKNFEKV